MDLNQIGLTNQHLTFSTDDSNISSKNNNYLFNQILSGNFDSPAFSYINNLGLMRLNDVKSISFYNASNLAAQINNFKPYEEIIDDSKVVFLPKKQKKIKTSLVKSLESRHSARKFSDIYIMSLEDMSTILKYSYGIAKRTMTFNEVTVSTRNYGSGGGLYPISVYLIINKVEGVKKGLYKYQPFSHSLLYINNDMDIHKLLQYGSFDFENYSFCTLYEYDINRTYTKYGELSLLISLIEIGLMSQNLDLVTSAMSYGICQIAGFDKHYAEKILGLDGINSNILFTNICGKE